MPIASMPRTCLRIGIWPANDHEACAWRYTRNPHGDAEGGKGIGRCMSISSSREAPRIPDVQSRPQQHDREGSTALGALRCTSTPCSWSSLFDV